MNQRKRLSQIFYFLFFPFFLILLFYRVARLLVLTAVGKQP